MSEKIAVHTPTKESYDRLMKAYEKKGWRWISNTPTLEYNWYSVNKEDTVVEFCNLFWQSPTSYYKTLWYTIITVEEALARLWQYERGQEVLVSDNGLNWDKGIYLATIEWATYPYIMVSRNRENEFREWRKFVTIGCKYIKPLEEPIKEMTMQEVETALGHKVKIVK